MMADDGYEAEVPIVSLTEESIFAYTTKGGLQTVLPGIGTGAWVKGVVEVRITAESEAAEEMDAEIVVVVNGIGFTQEEFAARAQVTVEATQPGKDDLLRLGHQVSPAHPSTFCRSSVARSLACAWQTIWYRVCSARLM